MSKKSKEKLQAAAAVAAAAHVIANEPDVRPALRLAEIQASARAHAANKAWAEVLALGRLPLTAIHEDDRKAAEVWIRTHGRFQVGSFQGFRGPAAANGAFTAAPAPRVDFLRDHLRRHC